MRTPIGMSIITCSKDPGWLRRCHAAVAQTTKGLYETVVIDNSAGQYSLAQAYNMGAMRAKYDMLCFLHEDCLILTNLWDECIQDIFYMAPQTKIIGVAGTTLLPDTGVWWQAGRPYIRGRVIHFDNVRQWQSHFSDPREYGVFSVVAVDGLFMVVRKSLMGGQRLFDEDTFKGFHFYDLDLSASISSRERDTMVVTHSINVAHAATSNMTDWEKYRQLFVQKYRAVLPLMTKDCVPGTSAPGWHVFDVPANSRVIPPWFLQLRADWARQLAMGQTTAPQEVHPLARPVM
jgi:hypothetical protein